MQTSTPTISEILLQSLEAIAADDVDFVPIYFERLLAKYPEETANFLNPGHSYGAMANDMLAMLLALGNDEAWVPPMMHSHMLTHQSHGTITLARYREALDLLVDVLADVAGPRWTPRYDAAWRAQGAKLHAMIANFWPREQH